MVDASIRHADATALIAVHKNLLFTLFWDFATLEHVAAVRRAVEEILTHHDGFATVVVIAGERMLSAFPQSVREELTTLVKDTEDTGVGTAFIILREGFVAATLRAILSGLFLVARSGEPNRAFQDYEAAGAWLEKRLHAPGTTTSWEPGEVAACLAQLAQQPQPKA